MEKEPLRELPLAQPESAVAVAEPSGQEQWELGRLPFRGADLPAALPLPERAIRVDKVPRVAAEMQNLAAQAVVSAEMVSARLPASEVLLFMAQAAEAAEAGLQPAELSRPGHPGAGAVSM